MHKSIVVLGLILLPSTSFAQDAFAIKLRKPGVGDVDRVTKTVVEQQKFQIRDLSGKVLKDGVQQRTLTFVFVETILEQPKPGQPPTRLKRVYEKAEIDIAGNKVQTPLQSKAVLIDKTGEKFTFRHEDGKPLTPDLAELLDKDFNKKTDPFTFERIILPAQPVQVGKPWTPNLAALVKEMTKESQMELADPAGSALLAKVYDKEGRKFGQIDLAIAFSIRSMAGDKGKTVALNPPGKLSVNLRMDGCIDGTLTTGSVTGAVNLQATLPYLLAENVNGQVVMDVVNSFTEQRVPAARK